jgi:hypothetical protein
MSRLVRRRTGRGRAAAPPAVRARSRPSDPVMRVISVIVYAVLLITPTVSATVIAGRVVHGPAGMLAVAWAAAAGLGVGVWAICALAPPDRRPC